MPIKKDALNWFELDAADFDRAQRFYTAILKAPLQDVPLENCESARQAGSRVADFPCNNMKAAGGSITKRKDIAPGAGGTIVNLKVEGDLGGVIMGIPTAGRPLVKPRTSIGEQGFIAIFKDTEGNGVGPRSLK